MKPETEVPSQRTCHTCRSLRILLLCTSDEGGGAAEACRRLLSALTEVGLEARLLVLNQGLGDERTSSVARGWGGRLHRHWAFLAERLEIYLRNGRSREQLFRVSTARWGFDLTRHPWVQWADVLHVHWINQGFLSLGGLRGLAGLGKPIFSTLHDLWSVTGICHLPLRLDRDGAHLCPRYELGCGKCPLLGSQREDDLSRRTWLRKRFLAEPPFRYLAVSRAEAELAERSPLLRDYGPVEVLTNPVDLSLFSRQRALARPRPSWWQAGRIYLTVVAARLDEPVKGPHLLVALTKHLQATYPDLAAKMCLLLIGGIKDERPLSGIAIDQRRLGRISDREELAALYALSTVVLSTSVYETLGQTLVEAHAVGTPAMAFCCGGPEDVIEEGRTGYLIPRYEIDRYADRLIELIEALDQGGFSSEACQRRAELFSSVTIAERLREKYEQALTLSL